ncbi:MAG: hypothetical protein RIF41_19215 [Polyangiaceae bacterium]
MSAARIDGPPPVILRPAELADCIAMWRVAGADVLSPFAYATLIRRLPPGCVCLVAWADDEVIGFVVAHRDGDAVVLSDMRLASDEPTSRLFELLHAVTLWPSLAGATAIEAERCTSEVRHAVASISLLSGPGLAKTRAPVGRVATTEGDVGRP